jgi:hypothetical protein
MSQVTLEERVAALEKQIAELKEVVDKTVQPRDWRSTIGMFSGNQAMKEIDAAGQAIREKERERARKQVSRKRRIKS